MSVKSTFEKTTRYRCFHALLHEVREHGPLRTCQWIMHFSISADLEQRLRWVGQQLDDFQAIFTCRFEELLRHFRRGDGFHDLAAMSCLARSKRRRNGSLIRTESVWLLRLRRHQFH